MAASSHNGRILSRPYKGEFGLHAYRLAKYIAGMAVRDADPLIHLAAGTRSHLQIMDK